MQACLYPWKPAPHLQRIVDDLAKVKAYVVEETGKLLDPEFNPQLRSNLETAIPVIWALGKMKNFAGGKFVVPYIHHGSEHVRFTALRALGEMGYHPAVPEIMKHGDAGVSKHPLGFYEWSSEEIVLMLKTLVKLGEADVESLEPYRGRFELARYRITGFRREEQLEQIIKLEQLLNIR